MSPRNTVPAFLDTVLDRTVAPGYTSIGYKLRRRGWSEGDPAADSLAGKTAMVTGANSGVGKAIAIDLARLGGTVLMTVRTREKGENARLEVLADVPNADVRVEVCDVSDLAAVRAFTDDMNDRYASLDVLIHNAGVMPEKRTETAEGHELSLTTHVLGPLLMTERLGPLFAAAADPRVIVMSSGGMYTQSLHVDDFEYREGDYKGATAYARTKRMQVALTPILADRWADLGLCVASMHPGWVDTPGVTASLPLFSKLTGALLREPAEGADTAVWLAATKPTPATGKFWHDRQPRPEHYLPMTKESDADRERLWRYCAEAVGINPK